MKLAGKTLPKKFIEMMASRDTRIHHFLWHEVRNSWLSIPAEDQKEIERLGWRPPRPALSAGGWPPLLHNLSGEDFLFKHRKMIHEVNDKLKSIGDPNYPKIESWKEIPPPDDPDDPVPPVYSIGDPKVDAYIARVKSKEFYINEIKPRALLFMDYNQLKKVTLGELGAQLEFTIHNWAHVRWSEKNIFGKKPDPKPPYNENTIDKKWDDPRYDWFADTYSSHVNPLFWKLHGWIDDRVEDWKKSHQLEKIEWKGTWDGPTFPEAHDIATMHKAIAILIKLEKCSHFYDERLILPMPNQK